MDNDRNTYTNLFLLAFRAKIKTFMKLNGENETCFPIACSKTNNFQFIRKILKLGFDIASHYEQPMKTRMSVRLVEELIIPIIMLTTGKTCGLVTIIQNQWGTEIWHQMLITQYLHKPCNLHCNRIYLKENHLVISWFASKNHDIIMIPCLKPFVRV